MLEKSASFYCNYFTLIDKPVQNINPGVNVPINSTFGECTVFRMKLGHWIHFLCQPRLFTAKILYIHTDYILYVSDLN